MKNSSKKERYGGSEILVGEKRGKILMENNYLDMKEQLEIEDLMQRSLNKAGFITPVPFKRGRKVLDLNTDRRSSIRLSKKERGRDLCVRNYYGIFRRVGELLYEKSNVGNSNIMDGGKMLGGLVAFLI